MREQPLNLFLVALLIISTAVSATDLYIDYFIEGDSLQESFFDIIIISATSLTVLYLIRSMVKRQQELLSVKAHLAQARKELTISESKLSKFGREFSKVIKDQFDEWQLTASEKEVASLLLKGLRFDEIAAVRNSKEKTARQQATAIYRKSGLSGRHEFAAWFFEDLL